MSDCDQDHTPARSSEVAPRRALRLGAAIFLSALSPSIGPAQSQTMPGSGASPEHLVFGHYVEAFPTYGQTIEAYKREIEEAQAFGIDGFALDLGGWSDPSVSYYQTRTSNMFEAAKELGTGFRLMLSPDMSGKLSAAEIRKMFSAYAEHPNYFRYGGRPVFTSWHGQSRGEDFWRNHVLKGLKEYNPLFVPFFFTKHGNNSWHCPSNEGFGNPAYRELSADYFGWWQSVVDGLNYFAVTGLPDQIASTGEAYASLMAENNKIWFAGVSPYFWEGRLDPVHQPRLLRRYYETHGGEGIETQWLSIIQSQKPLWVMLDTWNDYTESYLSPADPTQMPECSYFYNVCPLLKIHSGYAEFMKYYISWYKTGIQPAITEDALYYFYRTHSKNLYSPDDQQNVVLYGPGWQNGRVASATIPTYGEVLDDLYITTRLTAPATLIVTSGGVTSTYSLPASITNTRVPFNHGTQRFALWRNDVSIIHKEGDPIDATISAYNFTTTSGYAYGK